MTRSSLRLITLCCLLMLILAITPGTSAQIIQYEKGQRPGFPVVLSGRRIVFGSPTLANISGDSRPEIIVGGSDGLVYALTGAGQVLWTFNASAAIDSVAARPSGRPTAIRTAPAVGDITGNSTPEIVVALGEVFPEPMNGGVVALNASGQLLPGWPQLPIDFGGGGAAYDRPDGYADGVLSSPSIGDITGDGVPEIAYGANDQRVYVKTAGGSNLPGWPQFVLDTVWSSPALADLDGNGSADVIIGVDAHNYTGPPRNSTNGGDLYVFNGDGSIQWRAHQDEIFQSSPAVGDIDGDGQPEIVAGTGTYYSNLNPGSAIGRYISAWNDDGSLRWRTPLPQRVDGSPALGDINGDGTLEVVVGVLDGMVYALRGSNGAILWSTLARDIFNNQYLPNPQVHTPVLADYDGDGLDDVFIAQGWDVVVMKGTNGAQFTATSPSDPNRPSFYGSYTIIGTPAVGDLDNDGKLDLVSASGTTADPGNARVNSWRLDASSLKASWPMFRGNPRHTGTVATLVSSTTRLSSLIQVGGSRTYVVTIRNSDGSSVNWSASQTDPQNIIQLTPTSGTSATNLRVTINAPGSPGSYAASIRITAAGLAPITIAVELRAAADENQVLLPLIRR